MKLDGNMIMIQNARCAYPNLTKPSRPQAYPNSPLMYSVDAIISATDTVVAEVMSTIQELATDKWKDHAGNILQAIAADKKARSYHAGEEKLDKNLQRKTDIFPDGTFVITAKCKEDEKPAMIRPDGTTVAANDENAYHEVARTIYSGCYANLIIRPWLRLANPGISFRLIAIQFAKDGDRFASASAPDVTGMFNQVQEPAPVMGGFTAPAGTPGQAQDPATPAGVPDFMK